MAARQQIIIEAVDKVSGALGRIENRLSSLDKNVNGVQRGFRGAGIAASGFVAALAVQKIAQFANATLDAAATMEGYRNQLRLVTGSQQELEDTMGMLNDMAIANRQSFGDTVDLYGKLKLATDSLGVSNEQVTAVMSNFQKALAISGADANTASGAIRQFGQAMASGTVRGDEFNSIVEALGPALNIMARESGITVGELRKMSQAGELTAEKFFGMLEASNAINQAFSQTQKTINDLENEVADAATKMFATFAEESGLAQSYKGFLDDLARALRAVAGASTQLEAATPRMLAFNTELGSASQRLDELNKRTVRGTFGGPIQQNIQDVVNEFQKLNAALERGESLTFKQQGRMVSLKNSMTEFAKEQGISTDQVMQFVMQLEEQIKVQNALSEQAAYLNQVDQERQQVISGVLQKYGDLNARTAQMTKANEAALPKLTRLQNAFSANEELITQLERDIAIYGDTVEELQPALEAARGTQARLNNEIAAASETANVAKSAYQQYYDSLISRANSAAQESVFAQQAQQQLRAELDAGKISLDTYAAAMENYTTRTNTSRTATRDFAGELDGLESKYLQYLNNTQEAVRRAADQEISTLHEIAAARPELAQRAADIELAIERKLQNDKIAEMKRAADAQKALYNDQFRIFESGKFAELDLSKMTEDQKLKFAMDAGRSALSGLAQHNRRAFQLNKALMIAEAVINVATGVTKALAQGGIFGPLLAGAIVAAGAVQIATIRNMQYQGRAAGGEMTVGRPTVVGEAGPEVVVPKQPSVVMPNSVKERLDAMGGGGGGPVTVNFNITTLDAKDFDTLLIERRSVITGIINDAMTRRGRQGVMT